MNSYRVVSPSRLAIERIIRRCYSYADGALLTRIKNLNLIIRE